MANVTANRGRNKPINDAPNRTRQNELYYRLFKDGMFVTSLIILWYTLVLVTNRSNPITSVNRDTSMRPALCRGDLLLLSSNDDEKIEVGDVILHKSTCCQVEGEVFSRIVQICHACEKYFAKADNNQSYEPLDRGDVIARVRIRIRYIGMLHIWMIEYPNTYTFIKYIFYVYCLVKIMKEYCPYYSDMIRVIKEVIDNMTTST